LSSLKSVWAISGARKLSSSASSANARFKLKL